MRHVGITLIAIFPSIWFVRQFMNDDIPEETKRAAGIFMFLCGLALAIGLGLLL